MITKLKTSIIIFIFLLGILFLSSCGPDTEKFEKDLKELNRCESHLNAIGNAIHSFKMNNNGALPRGLNDLVKAGFINEVPKCPATGNRYIYTYDPRDPRKRFIIKCPNPEKHVGKSGPKSKTKELYYDTDRIIHK